MGSPLEAKAEQGQAVILAVHEVGFDFAAGDLPGCVGAQQSLSEAARSLLEGV